MKLPPDLDSATGHSTWPETAGFHPVSRLMQPVLTEWLLESTFAGGRRGQQIGYVLLNAELVSEQNMDYGPGARQALLRHVGKELHDMLRGADYGGHLSAHELLILLPGEGQTGAASVAERITDRLNGASLSIGPTVQVRAVPFAFKPDLESANEMLAKARQQLSSTAHDTG